MDAAGAPSGFNPIMGVINYWKDFDLESQRAKLDDNGMQIASKQEASLKSRKKLADATKGPATQRPAADTCRCELVRQGPGGRP